MDGNIHQKQNMSRTYNQQLVNTFLGKINAVIPGRREAASPESITTIRVYGFRARAKRRVPE
jgi:hypothetical protein